MTLLLMLLFKSLLVLALSGTALACLRRASASARHLVCLLTLYALLALPLFSLALPGWHLRVLREEPTPSQVTPLPEREGAEVKTPAAPLPAAHSGSAALQPNAAVPSETPRIPVPGGQALALRVASAAPGRFLALLYLLGLILASARPLLGLWGIHRLSRACVDVADAPTLGVLADCADALRLRRLPRLCRADVPVPMTWGWHRPVILPPSASADWPEDRLRSVLLHEMAHVKRRDWPGHRLADLACALYWFHPFVWLTARRLRAESEIACDDLVLASGIPAPDYARHLLEIAGALSRPLPSQSAIAMAQTPHIKRRILMILDTTRRRTSPRRFLLLAAVAGDAALVPLSMLQPTAKAQDASAPAQNFSNGVVQLIGITDRTSLGGKGWDANGKKVSVQVANNGQREALVGSAKPGQKIVFFALHSTPPLQDDSIVFHDTASGDGYQWPISSHAALFAETYPAPLLKTTFQVGVTSGPWTETVNCPKTIGKVDLQRPSGEVIFTLTPHPHHTPLVEIAHGDALLMVSDHFHSPSPPAHNPRQAAQSAGMNLDQAVYALDSAGRVVTKIAVIETRHITIQTSPNAASKPGGYSRMKTEYYALIPNALLKHTASFRLVARPYQWTEFKDVALEPVKP